MVLKFYFKLTKKISLHCHSHQIMKHPAHPVHVDRPADMHAVGEKDDADLPIGVDPDRRAGEAGVAVAIF